MSNVAAEAKFRWDKPSRLIRMERGTCCYRFTLLFLSVLIVRGDERAWPLSINRATRFLPSRRSTLASLRVDDLLLAGFFRLLPVRLAGDCRVPGPRQAAH